MRVLSIHAMTGGKGMEARRDTTTKNYIDNKESSYKLTMEEDRSNTSTAECADKELENQVWIFGYGSLLWKVNFPHQDRVVGYVNGYDRGFWQGSTDHRGAPEAPGRVVTLIKKEHVSTWGVAYRVQPRDVPEVMAYLENREIRSGYSIKELLFHPQNTATTKFTVLVYIATESNPCYMGHAPLDEIARQICRSRGKSGPNVEYLLRLANEMRTIAPHIRDDHLFELETLVLRSLRKEQKPTVKSIVSY